MFNKEAITGFNQALPLYQVTGNEWNVQKTEPISPADFNAELDKMLAKHC
jgi:hypothetical protein